MMKQIPLIIFAFCCFVSAVQAQQSVDIKDTVQDRTFWHERFPGRYYFGADGTFLLQYTTATETHAAGAVREGAWDIGENNRLCWTLKDEGINRCYDLAEDLLAKRPWHAYDNVYELKEAGRPANILWNRWMHGNLITKPAVYEAISEGKTPPLDKEAYKAAIVGKIMRLPLGYVYHRADGTAFWTDEKTAERIGKNSALVDDRPQDGKMSVWTLDTGPHCYLTLVAEDKLHPFCTVVVSGQDLYVPQEGWVQIMDDNFIRLVRPADLMPVE